MSCKEYTRQNTRIRFPGVAPQKCVSTDSPRMIVCLPGVSRPLRGNPTAAGLLGERAAITGDGPGVSRPLRFNPTGVCVYGHGDD